MASLRGATIAIMKMGGHRNIAAATRHHARDATRTLATPGLGPPRSTGLPEVPGGRDGNDMQVVKRSNGARRNALGQQARGKLLIRQQGPHQVGRHPAMADRGDRPKPASKAGHKRPHSVPRRP